MNSHQNSTEENSDKQVKNEDAVQQFLSFTIGDESYGVDLMSVREIKGWSQNTQLPRLC